MVRQLNAELPQLIHEFGQLEAAVGQRLNFIVRGDDWNLPIRLPMNPHTHREDFGLWAEQTFGLSPVRARALVKHWRDLMRRVEPQGYWQTAHTLTGGRTFRSRP